MEFLKKHYEKILLGLVLAGLVGALVFMPFYISADNEQTSSTISTILNNPSVKQLPDLDLSVQAKASARLKEPYVLDLETSNRTFNPMEWKRAADGSLVLLANHVGPQMVMVTNITPLYLIITLDSVTTNELGARYNIGVEKQGEKQSAKRHKLPHN